MKHHYNKEELVELKRKYDMQVSKEALEEIEDLKEQVKYQDLWKNEYLSRINKATSLISFICFNSTRALTLKECNKLYHILMGSDKE